MVTLKTLHPDDVLFFTEVAGVMRTVARQYQLPLRAISPATMPTAGMADFLGTCSHDGHIHLVMRATVDGMFVDVPRTPADVWRTAAHELAHLRHFDHSHAFREFHAELLTAIDNQHEDHQAKIIDKLNKMRKSRDGEQAIGNSAAAEAFAGAINRMMMEYELHPSDLDYARTQQDDPVIEMQVEQPKYGIKQVGIRLAWQEQLARIVAKAHLCSFLISSGRNDIWFVGTRSHVIVAEYVYGTLVPAADRMSYLAKRKHADHLLKTTGRWAGVNGFREAWLDAFIQRVAERFAESRKAAVAEAVVDLPLGSESQALMRLDGALVKVTKYIDDKFSGKRKSLHALSTGRSTNAEGRRQGREAADAMPIGRRGVTVGSTPKGFLGS